MRLVRTVVPGLSRDRETGMVVSSDRGAAEAAKIRRTRAREGARLASRVERLEREVERLSALLGVDK